MNDARASAMAATELPGEEAPLDTSELDRAIGELGARVGWYRRLAMKAVQIALFACVWALGATAAASYFYRYIPDPQILAMTQDGRYKPLIPIGEPNNTPSRITQWAIDTFGEVNDYHFKNYRDALSQPCNERFTPKGCQDFLSALEESGNLIAVKTRKLLVYGNATGAAVIKDSRRFRGRYTWIVEFPAIITYENANKKNDQRVVVTLTLARYPWHEHPDGVAVERYIAEPR